MDRSAIHARSQTGCWRRNNEAQRTAPRDLNSFASFAVLGVLCDRNLFCLDLMNTSAIATDTKERKERHEIPRGELSACRSSECFISSESASNPPVPLPAPRNALGFDLVVAQVAAPADLDAAIASLAEQKVDAILTSTSLIFNLRSKLLELANARRLPVLGHRTELAEAGALISYGAPLAEQMRRAAALVDKVLRGEKPADIPVEQPSVFELVVNLKAARALGITIPHAVLLRADRVIE